MSGSTYFSNGTWLEPKGGWKSDVTVKRWSRAERTYRARLTLVARMAMHHVLVSGEDSLAETHATSASVATSTIWKASNSLRAASRVAPGVVAGLSASRTFRDDGTTPTLRLAALALVAVR